MHIIKLPWLGHRAENKFIECYATSINHTGTRLATGGLDGNVKIWDTKLILRYKDYQPEEDTKDGLIDRMDVDELPLELKRPVASMSRHNGAVTCVKFSPDGKFLASGSDDKIILVWEKDEEQTNRPKQFGETEADLEHWMVRKRLVAHDNDVQDICWSPDGSLLITVGLDRSIIIWSGTTFERIKRYDIHQSMVKGIVFDPANKFFATASDDRTVRIFRYSRKLNDASANNYEFQVEHIVMDPFKKSPLTSYFRRMSWSPDGQHIAVPNATNGPVTAVVIINRGNWATDVSLIGHEAPCEVCSFSPRLFHQGDSKNKTDQYMTILATGGQDRTLAIWSTGRTKPLVVAEEVVENAITDICWAPDGQSLFLTSLDGSVTCVIFEEKELGEVVAEDVNDSQLLRYGGDRELTIFAESAQQLELEELAAKQGNVISARPLTPPIEVKQKTEEGFTTAPSTPQKPKEEPVAPKKVNVLTQSVKITKDGKKRVAPMLVSSSSAPPKNNALLSQPAPKSGRKFEIASKISQTPYFLPRLGIQTSVHGLKHRDNSHGDDALKNNEDQDNDNEDIGMDDPNAGLSTYNTGGSFRKKMKRYRRWLMVHKYPTPFKYVSDLPNVLFRNAAVMNHELGRLIQKKDIISSQEMINPSSIDAVDENIMFQVVVKSVQHLNKQPKYESLNENGASEHLVTSIIEVRNGSAWPEDDASMNADYAQRLDFQDPTQVIVTNNELNDTRDYILYFPFRIQQVLPILFDDSLYYYVLISFDGAIQIVHAHSGSYLTPLLELGSNVIFAKQSESFILVVTGSGLVYTWELSGANKLIIKGVMKGVSVASVINSETKLPKSDPEASKKGVVPSVIVDIIRSIDVDAKTGMPFITLQNTNSVYTYSKDLMVWIKAVDPWYFLALEETEVQLNLPVLQNVLRKTYSLNHEQIEKGKKGRYTFDENNKELKENMQQRFHELVELI